MAFRGYGLVHNWKDSLHCVVRRESILVFWPPPSGELNSNVVGAGNKAGGY